jgi:hypothetical protein
MRAIPGRGALDEKGTPAPFKCALLNESTFVDGYVYGGIVEEVSLLQMETPAEPGGGAGSVEDLGHRELPVGVGRHGPVVPSGWLGNDGLVGMRIKEPLLERLDRGKGHVSLVVERDRDSRETQVPLLRFERGHEVGVTDLVDVETVFHERVCSPFADRRARRMP